MEEARRRRGPSRGGRGPARPPRARGPPGARRSSCAPRTPKPGASGKHAAAGARAHEPLARERLTRRGARAQPHEARARPAWRSRSPPPTRRLKAATARSASLSRQRAERAAQVGVDEQQRARRRGPLAGGERLALSEPLDAEHGGARGLGALRGAVPRASVDDEHLCVREVAREGGDGLADPLLLVPRRERGS